MSIAVQHKVSRISRALLSSLIALIAVPFTSQPASGYSVAVPTKLNMTVRETAGVARNGEVLRSGVPIPRSLNLRGTGALAVVDAAGAAVPAQFEVTARWNAGLADTTAPIQWLMVSFPASVGARGTATYRLVTNGTVANPAPARPLRLTQSGNLITVDTGAAVFRFGGDAGALFEEVALASGTRLALGGSMTARANGAATAHPTTRNIRIEHSGPLSAAVVVHGAYDLAPVGNGGLGSLRRYVFTAGSPTAVVRHAVQWEGNLGCNGCTKTTAGTPNGVRLDQVRDTLSLTVGGTPTVTAVGDFDAAAVSGGVAAGQTAAVRQLLRSARTSPLAFQVNVGGASASGAQADGGVLAASGTAGAVAIALNHMHRYEPQALRLLADGSLAVDVADGSAWLAHHQGLFATMAVSALAANPTRAQLDEEVWAPLNRPLRAWPEAAWFGASDAVDEVPVGPLPASLASYDTLIPSVLDRTLQQTDQLGISGLMTYGLFPRYWGKTGAEGEIDCLGTADPTPAETWDNTFWCTTWTDYHNTASTAPIWAMRSGQVEWLDEIAAPAALRMLHTQIMRCSPTEKWFYCGQAPAGYGGYRLDFNSSHAYSENLQLYYWLTGDSVVVETLQRGGENMRRMMCDTRGPRPVIEPLTGPGGPACGADHVSTTSEFTGRVASQWINLYRFLGHASNDGTFLEDFQSSLARALTQHYVELVSGGSSYGFLGERSVVPGTYIDGPMWMHGFYDTNNLFRLLRDIGDTPIGNPAISPSRAMGAIARTLQDIEPTVIGDGSTNGDWPKNLEYTWAGARIGGSLVAVIANDRPIFTPEKTSVTALFLRSGELSGDAAMRAKGEEMVRFALGAANNEEAPLGKLNGQYLTRLHAAVARLTNGGSAPPPPPDPTVPAAPSGLVASPVSATEIDLAWIDASNDEDAFHVEQLIGGAYQEVRVAAANATGLRVGGLTASTAYSFRVRASNEAGPSGYSNTAAATTQTPPPTGATIAAPTSLTAVAVSTTEIQLNWQDNASNEANFRIEKLVGGVFQQFKMVGPNITAVTVTGLAAGTSYTFRVRAGSPEGVSGYSNNATASTKSLSGKKRLAAPAPLTARAISPTEVELTWNDNSADETDVRIEKLSADTFREIRRVGANQVSARVAGLAPNQTYSFRVRATNGTESSPYSTVVRVTTKPAARRPRR